MSLGVNSNNTDPTLFVCLSIYLLLVVLCAVFVHELPLQYKCTLKLFMVFEYTCTHFLSSCEPIFALSPCLFPQVLIASVGGVHFVIRFAKYCKKRSLLEHSPPAVSSV